MRPYRDIATVAALQVVRFPGRAHFEPQFFLLHLYQTIVYVALLILPFYREDGRAYTESCGPVLEHDCNRARQWVIEEKQPQSDLTN